MKTLVVRKGRISIRDQKGFARIAIGKDPNVFVLGPKDLYDLHCAIDDWMASEKVEIIK